MSSNLLHLLSFSLLILPFFLVSMAAAQSNDSSYPQCLSYNCGNINISYPFWKIGIETTTQFCGFPNFGINCVEGPRGLIPSIYLGNDSYYIRNIIYERSRSSIVLVDYDVSIVVPPVVCPRVRHNISFGTLPFFFVDRSVNISFHFNCTGGVPVFATEIGCLSNDTAKSCVNMLNAEPADFSWDGYSCDEAVVTTVLDVFGEPNRLGTEFPGALRGGFELRWESIDTDDCEKCENSDGRCGYNNNTMEFLCFCSGGTTTTNGDCKGSALNWKIKLIVGVLSGLFGTLLVGCILFFSRKSSQRNCVALFKHKTEDDKSVEAFFIQYGSLNTKRYTYAEIKNMTNSFRVKLGQGGFGIVFKGKLSDGRLVAVKILNSSKASGQEFINEVASIGRTSHVNIVTLLGYCFDYQNRALVYEFMPNGSLEKFKCYHDTRSTSEHIGLEKLYEISLGIARGLDYLHRGCNTRILHLDIKPHNILLDEDFCPKIADFGLAKLYSRKESIVSMLEARGTIGYIAPEVFNRNFGGVSHKSDVYSYGMLILEIVGGRNINVEVDSADTSEIMYFPNWIYSRLNKNEFLFDGVTSSTENEYVRKMSIVGLWCIQTNPNQRPSINEVIDMLERSMDNLQIPPKPFFSSPPRSPATTFNTSQEVSDEHCILQRT